MKTIRVLTTALFCVIISFFSIDCSSDRAQAETAAVMKASKAALQREKQEFVSLMERKIATFRQSLDEMKALAGNVSSQTRIEINRHNAEMERLIEAAEKNLAELKTSNHAAFN